MATRAAANPDIIGKQYEDGTGNTYLELFRQPVLIYEGKAADLSVVHRRALERDLRMAVYTVEVFGTGNDDDNRAVVLACTELDLARLALYGPAQRRRQGG